jgi:hypothetical protein
MAPDKILAKDLALKMAKVKRHEQQCDNTWSGEEEAHSLMPT